MEMAGGVLGLIALITWVIAAVGGAIMLWIWVSRGGARRTGEGSTRFPPGLIFGHFLLAAAGLVVWIIYLVTDAVILSWISFIILLIVAGLGLTMFARWAGQPRAGAAGAVRRPNRRTPLSGDRRLCPRLVCRGNTGPGPPGRTRDRRQLT